jgi:two-component sensor histidine kinase
MNSPPFSVPADDFPEPMLLISADGEVLAINRAAREDFGLGAVSPIGRLCDLVSDAGEKVMTFVRLCSSTREAVPGALSFRTPAGILDCRCDGRRTSEGLVYLRCRPRAASNQAFAVLNEKIAELALIQELHHRIGNSIQVAISLAGLQMREASAGPIRQQFLKYSLRLKAIGLVYRTLYRDQDFTRLDISTFVSDLCAELRRTYQGPEISLSTGIDATLLSLDQAVPFALIVNELVINALVHAFEPDGRGSIQVSLRHSPQGLLELTIADNGVGMSAELPKSGTGGKGLDLVRMLARQLDASFEIDRGQGTTFRLTFKDTVAGSMPS